MSPQRNIGSNGGQLTERERVILRLVVKNFIDTAGPVGSKFLSDRFKLGLSSASIRSTMNDLEAKGFLDHPYTSAGRVPTHLGYRAFVDHLMESAVLSPEVSQLMKTQIVDVVDDSEALFRESSRLLAHLARLLGVVLSPQLTSGVLERLEIVPVSSDRVMFIISVEGGLFRTIVLHVSSGLRREKLERLVELLNERLVGLTLDEIRRTCVPRVYDLKDEETGIVQLILDESSLLFSDSPEGRTVEVGGTRHILAQPEFAEPKRIRQLLELLDDDSSVVRLLEDADATETQAPGRARVFIGKCSTGEDSDDSPGYSLSVVTAPYRRSNLRGTIGVIGPVRMNYARVIALVQGVAMLMSWPGIGGDASHQA